MLTFVVFVLAFVFMQCILSLMDMDEHEPKNLREVHEKIYEEKKKERERRELLERERLLTQSQE